MKLGYRHSIGRLVDVGGSQVIEDLEAWLEIRSFDILKNTDGILFAFGRRSLWMRIDKFKIKYFQNFGQEFNKLFKTGNPIVERIQTTFFIDKADPIANMQ